MANIYPTDEDVLLPGQTESVIGILLSRDSKMSCLVKVGDHWEPLGSILSGFEDPRVAVIKVCKSQTGIELLAWRFFAVMRSKSKVVYVFVGQTDKFLEVDLPDHTGVFASAILPLTANPILRWLIPMALDKSLDGVQGISLV